MSRSHVHFGLLLSLGLSLAACAGRPVPLREARTALLAQPQEETALRAAIARALKTQRFTAESEEPGVVVAQLDKGRVRLRVRIAYTPSQYEIKYVDSDGLGYKVTEAGAPVISDRYDRYTRDLAAAIDDELGRPAREARKAVDEQRRHELEVIEAERRKEQDARADEARERDRDRAAAIEQERLRAEAARARAEARRPIIVQQAPEPSRVVVVVPPGSDRRYISPRGATLPPPPPPAPTCSEVLLEKGHSSSALMFCKGAEPRCAVALLRAGHNPSALMHCQGVQPDCAENMMRRGDNPAALLHCR